MKKLIALSFVCMVGCSSAARLDDNREIVPDKTLSTLNDSSQPSWADEAKPQTIQGQDMMSVGVTTISDTDSLSMGLRVAENNSRVNLAKTIENKLEYYFQNAEQSGGIENSQAKSLGSETTQLTTHSLKLESYWYKRYVTTQETGRHIFVKIYALTSMPVKDVRTAMDQAISGKVNEHKLSEDFKAKADAQFSKILGVEDTKTASK